MNVLITGGAGYIGSHTSIEFLDDSKEVYILDNLSNSSIKSIKQIEKISNKKINFINGDIRDKNCLKNIFNNKLIDCVIHFAGLKAVGESVKYPLKYYDNNVIGTINLLQQMNEFNIKKIIFSSSATVYGDTEHVPFSELSKLGQPSNPYGQTKLIIENILRDVYASDKDWSIAILRYFNPIGAHKSGLIGEDPKGIPNNLMPYISQVASGKLSELSIYGNDYDTHDGTGIRDYIHVVDLAIGHLKAFDYIINKTGCYTWNLGTGTGYSVLDIVNKFINITQQNIKYKFVSRREGDVAKCWADVSKANNELSWYAEKTLEDMIKDAWNWQTKNPDGYGY